MTNIVIVEDEYMVAKRLKRFVEQAFAEQTIKITTCHSLDDANDYLDQHSIDLLFLDLNLQGHDGFTLLKEQLSESFHTIVVSANSDRAIEAFDIGVLDFVAKPFTQERIQKAVDRLQQKQTGHCKYLTYKRLGKIELLAIEQVQYLKAEGHYCEVFMHNHDSFLHDKSLDKLTNLLPDNFIRIHRSYAVAIDCIQSIKSEEGSKYWLTLKSGHRLPVGRTKAQAIKAILI
jgi:two-component system, LytTR family, response regulator LytT